LVLQYRFVGLVALFAATLGSARADQLNLGAAAGYNVFSLNNLSMYSTTIQGKVAVGGAFAPSGGGLSLATGSHDGTGVYDLVVAGNFTMSAYSMAGGDIFVGGNMTWNNPSTSNNIYVAGNFTDTGGGNTGTVYYGGTYNGPGYLSHVSKSASSMPTPIDFLTAKTNLESLSTTLAGDAPNGTVSSSGSTWTLTGASSSLNVFNLSASSYSGATININAPAGSTVVVNIAGSADSFSGGSINLTGVSASNVIYNFNTATTLSLSSIAFYGTILAPLADFTGSGGQINGQLIAKSVAGTTSMSDTEFAGTLGAATATPEPSTWLLFLAGAGVFSFTYFSRRRVR